jgi:putative membrane protein
MKRGYQFTVYHSGQGGHGGVNNTGSAGIFIKWIILTAAVMITAYLFDSITVTGFFSALFAAAVIGMLNMLLRPILIILTLPVNIMTFGLFTFLINALMLKMASGLISGFTVTGFWSTVFGAVVISIVNWILNVFLLTFIQTGDRGAPPVNPGEIELKNRGGRWE